ncbi:hypothetical protein SDC9_82032 [bioreactor metagenome]|uniref:Uncharacterized protein n=1 Tax=bioreactor metagenome TaxID=1076179 RepID=A0A644Z3I0_9ZZZZ
MFRQIFPQCFAGCGECTLAVLEEFFPCTSGPLTNIACNLAYNKIGIEVIALDHFHTTVYFPGFLHPESKSGQRCCYRWNMKCHSFERSVSPWFVIGRKYRQIASNQKIVIIEIKQPIVAIEITGNENNIHLAFVVALQAVCMSGLHDCIIVFVEKIMGQIAGSACYFIVLHALLHILTDTGIVCRYCNNGNNIALGIVLTFQFSQCFNKQINAFVSEFITAGINHI